MTKLSQIDSSFAQLADDIQDQDGRAPNRPLSEYLPTNFAQTDLISLQAPVQLVANNALQQQSSPNIAILDKMQLSHPSEDILPNVQISSSARLNDAAKELSQADPPSADDFDSDPSISPSK